MNSPPESGEARDLAGCPRLSEKLEFEDNNNLPDETREYKSSHTERPKVLLGSFLFVRSDVDEAGLTPLQFRVLGHLQRRAGKDGLIYPSVQKIADVCRIHHRTAKKAISELREIGVIMLVLRPGRTNLYRINPPDQWKIDPAQKTAGVKKLPGSNKPLESLQNLSWESVQKSTPKGNPHKGIQDKSIQSTSFSDENEVCWLLKQLEDKGISEKRRAFLQSFNKYAQANKRAIYPIDDYTDQLDKALDRHEDDGFEVLPEIVETAVRAFNGTEPLKLVRIIWGEE